MHDKIVQRRILKVGTKMGDAKLKSVGEALTVMGGAAIILVCGVVNFVDKFVDTIILQASGFVTQATIVDLYDYNEYPDDVGYRITYQFEIPSPDDGGQQRLTGKQWVDYAVYKSVKLWGTVKIIYAADDPSVSRIMGTGGINLWDLLIPIIGLVSLRSSGPEAVRLLRDRGIIKWPFTSKGRMTS